MKKTIKSKPHQLQNKNKILNTLKKSVFTQQIKIENVLAIK